MKHSPDRLRQSRHIKGIWKSKFSAIIKLTFSIYSDFNIIQINDNYNITKEWLKSSLSELELIHATIRTKSQVSKVGQSGLATADSRQSKQKKENAMRSLETSLFTMYAASRDPYWLNLILIENCRDLKINKYSKMTDSLANFKLCIVLLFFHL